MSYTPSRQPPSKCGIMMPLAIFMTLFYGLPRLAFDTWKERRRNG